MRRMMLLLAALLTCGWSAAAELDPGGPTLRLALDLSASGDHAGAAVEFRRLAMTTRDTSSPAGYWWAAGYAYWRAGNAAQSEYTLDRMEDTGDAPASSLWLLRAENARDRQDDEQALHYLKKFHQQADDPVERIWASRRLAAAQVRSGQYDAAREILAEAPDDQSDFLEALNQHEQGRNKRPWLGGLLGLVPGMGYVYAGEYANGLRSLLLNAIFIYGMVDTADDDQWGAFTVISFFEATWYAGSVFGGIDASHRYNQNRLDQTLFPFERNLSFRPDFNLLPLISLEYSF